MKGHYEFRETIQKKYKELNFNLTNNIYLDVYTRNYIYLCETYKESDSLWYYYINFDAEKLLNFYREDFNYDYLSKKEYTEIFNYTYKNFDDDKNRRSQIDIFKLLNYRIYDFKKFNYELKYDGDNLVSIIFPEYYTKLVDKLPNNLQSIVFGYWFNQPVDKLPNNLQYIIFGSSFNQPVDKLPNNLQYIEFGKMFNQPVDNLPNNLISITFGEYFNQPVDNLPNNLESIIFGSGFNQPVDNLPNNLQSITFGYMFNQPVDKLPNNLQSIEFGDLFKKLIKKLPIGLKKLYYRKEPPGFYEFTKSNTNCEIVNLEPMRDSYETDSDYYSDDNSDDDSDDY